jgi:hypothetical protein
MRDARPTGATHAFGPDFGAAAAWPRPLIPGVDSAKPRACAKGQAWLS